MKQNLKRHFSYRCAAIFCAVLFCVVLTGVLFPACAPAQEVPANKGGYGGGNIHGEVITDQAGTGTWSFDAADVTGAIATASINTRKLSTTGLLGTSLVTNGSMAANITGWTGSHWAWSPLNGGMALHTASSGYTAALTQSAATVVSGQPYVITYTVQYGTAGNVTMSCGGLSDSARSASGTFTYYGTATATTAIAFTPTATFDGGVQLVSVQTQGPALTSCGTSPSIQQGSDRTAGNVTMGSSSPTACTVTFAAAFTNTPACIVIPYTAADAAVIPTISASNTAFTVSFSATATAPATAPAAATGFSYACVGLNE
jgi:hypothetical protein